MSQYSRMHACIQYIHTVDTHAHTYRCRGGKMCIKRSKDFPRHCSILLSMSSDDTKQSLWPLMFHVRLIFNPVTSLLTLVVQVRAKYILHHLSYFVLYKVFVAFHWGVITPFSLNPNVQSPKGLKHSKNTVAEARTMDEKTESCRRPPNHLHFIYNLFST